MKKLLALLIVASFILAACGASEQPAATSVPQQEPGAPKPTKTLPDSATFNAEHLAKLMEGVDAWNAWRTQNAGTKPDLTRADLAKRNLADFDFTSANMIKANLTDANLSRAILRSANLTGANLTGARLKNAKLINTRLAGADLSGADLTGAKLTGAQYDATTIWPAGFDPIAAGAVLEQ
jgi:uncharacterized protein YjbI with pentapeptide repeats